MQNEFFDFFNNFKGRISDLSIFVSNDYLAHNEIGLAIDSFIDNLHEEEVKITKVEFSFLRKIVIFFERDDRYGNLEILHNLIEN